MASTLTVMCVVLVCAVGSMSAANAGRRQARSPFTPELQTWVAKAAQEQVRLVAKIGRAMKILPPKPGNDTEQADNSTIAQAGNPFAVFGTIPLKIVSVVQEAKADNKTVEVKEVDEVEEVNSANAQSTQEPVKLPEQVVEVDAKPAEALPKPLELKSSDIDQSKSVVDKASVPPTPAVARETSAVTVPVSVAADTDSEDEATDADDSDAEINPDPLDDSAHTPVPRDIVDDSDDEISPDADGSAPASVPRVVADVADADEPEPQELDYGESEYGGSVKDKDDPAGGNMM